MSRPPAKLPIAKLAAVVKAAEEQARQLAGVNRWAAECGMEGEVSDEQLLTLLHYQTALAALIVTLVQEKTHKL